MSAKDIQRWNGLGPDDPIKLGQKLNIWTDEVGSRPAKIGRATSKKVGYTVQSGDSLIAIASKFNVEVDDILRWNQVNPRALLQPGQRLTLFVSRYTGAPIYLARPYLTRFSASIASPILACCAKVTKTIVLILLDRLASWHRDPHTTRRSGATPHTAQRSHNYPQPIPFWLRASIKCFS